MQWANPAAGGMIQGDGGQQQEEEEDDDEEKPTDRPVSWSMVPVFFLLSLFKLQICM